MPQLGDHCGRRSDQAWGGGVTRGSNVPRPRHADAPRRADGAGARRGEWRRDQARGKGRRRRRGLRGDGDGRDVRNGLGCRGAGGDGLCQSPLADRGHPRHHLPLLLLGYRDGCHEGNPRPHHPAVRGDTPPHPCGRPHRGLRGLPGPPHALRHTRMAGPRSLWPHRRHRVPGVPCRGAAAHACRARQRRHRLPAPHGGAAGVGLFRGEHRAGWLRGDAPGRGRALHARGPPRDPPGHGCRHVPPPGIRVHAGGPRGLRDLLDAPGGAVHGGRDGDGEVGVQGHRPRAGHGVAHDPRRDP
mmetsp:Transcript_14806/g.47221  ORF Transcript_14806/g.47221 Transcript_14806/m.47221 type:complete len:300 (+) Transcript_14806:236-1135(+)